MIPRPLSEITDAEKIAVFDKIHASAMETWEYAAQAKRIKDDKHYTWEQALEWTLAKDGERQLFWDEYNKLPGYDE